MTSNHTLKYAIGFLTAFVSLFPFLMLPVLGLLFVLDIFLLLMPSKVAACSHIILVLMVSALSAVFLITLCFKIIQFGLKIFYIIYEIENKSLTNIFRVTLVIGTVFLPYIAMPIYYFTYIGRENPKDSINK
jgi:hypothetical protein